MRFNRAQRLSASCYVHIGAYTISEIYLLLKAYKLFTIDLIFLNPHKSDKRNILSQSVIYIGIDTIQKKTSKKNES